MPADIELRRLTGLHTSNPSNDGDLNELVQADNIVFNRDGIAVHRAGFHFFTNSPTNQEDMAFLGKLDPSGFSPTIPGRRLFGDGTDAAARYRKWEGGKDVPNLPLADAAYVTPPTSLNPVGVQYIDKLYLLQGKNWNGTTIATTTGQPAPTSGAIAVHGDRLWVSDATVLTSYRLYFSAPGNPLSWPAANFIDVGSDSITAIRSFQNRLFIFKRKALWILETPGVPTTWVLRKFADIGAGVAATTEHEGVLYWVNETGMYSYDGATITKLSEQIDDVFDEIGIHVMTAPLVSVAGFGDWVIFAGLSEKVSPTQTLIYCFHTRLGYWSRFTGYFTEPSGYQYYNFWAEPVNVGDDVLPGLYMTLFHSPHGIIIGTEVDTDPYEVDEFGTQTGTPSITEDPYDIVVKTKFADVGEPMRKKRVHNWLLETEGGAVAVTQTNETGNTKTTSILAASARDVSNQNHVPGIGYARRIAVTLTVTGFRDLGFKFVGMFGKVIARGREAKNKSRAL